MIPLFKKADKLKTNNYHPVSLLCAISKLFEKNRFQPVIWILYKKIFFFDSQYGFRVKHSTELATIELVDRVLHSFDNKELPLTIFMDLSKAFDTLDHNILLKKLRYYGIEGTPLKWFTSYLNQRSQYVELNGSQSHRKIILTGVPQGSILGPLLFLI